MSEVLILRKIKKKLTTRRPGEPAWWGPSCWPAAWGPWRLDCGWDWSTPSLCEAGPAWKMSSSAWSGDGDAHRKRAARNKDLPARTLQTFILVRVLNHVSMMNGVKSSVAGFRRENGGCKILRKCSHSFKVITIFLPLVPGKIRVTLEWNRSFTW